MVEANNSAKSRTDLKSGTVRPGAIAVAILFLAGVTMAVESSAVSLTFDELLTWFTATLATPQLVWRSLAVAPLPVDPPLFHWIAHYAVKIVGESDIAIRIPSMAGMLLALWLIYVFTGRMTDRKAGLLAMSFVVASGAFAYGYDARPYGLVLASAAGALLAWQNIVRGRSRLISVICFGGCLAAADSLHYYSVLLCVPFVVGELVRARRARKIDWLVLSAMIAGNAVMLLFLPLLPAARAYRINIYRGVNRSDVLNAYRMLFHSFRTVGFLLVLLAALYFVRLVSDPARRRNGMFVPFGKPFPEELATLVSFALYPLAVFALSLSVTHTFSERYALPAVLGLSVLAAMATRTLARSDVILFLMAGLVLCSALVHAVQSVRREREPDTRYAPQYAPALSRDTTVFDQLPESAEIVVPDIVLYLRMMRYAPESIQRRLVLVDFTETPTREGRRDTGDLVRLGIRTGVRLPFITLSELNHLKVPFFLVCCRSFEAREERIEAVRNNPHIRAVDAGAFRYWPVFAMESMRP